MRASIADFNESAGGCDIIEPIAIATAAISGTATDFVPDAMCMTFLQEQRAHDERDERNGDRVNKACVDVAGARYNCRSDQRKESTEPPVTEVIWQRHRRVPDPRRERFDEERGNRPVNHGDENHLDEHE